MTHPASNTQPRHIVSVKISMKSSGEAGVFATDWYQELKSKSSPGENLREMREWMDVSVAELFRQTGISQPHIIDMENGTRPIGAKTAEKIANVLECSPESFVENFNSPKFQKVEMANV